MCRSLGLRDVAVNMDQQTLMKRQETDACWQTLSAPTAGIRFYLETDVMVMDTRSSHQPGIHAIDFSERFSRVIKEL